MITKETLETNLERVHEWIKAADQKVSIFLAFQGVVVALLFSDIFFWIKRSAIKMSSVSIILFIISLVLICFSFYKSAMAIIPRLKNHKGKKSITYFGDIASIGLDHFRKNIKEISKEDYDEELISQIHIS